MPANATVDCQADLETRIDRMLAGGGRTDRIPCPVLRQTLEKARDELHAIAERSHRDHPADHPEIFIG